MEIKAFCKEAHEIAMQKGFWKEPRAVSELLMLIVSELGEACEADRKEDWNNLKEEIADTFIRLGDMCEALDIDIESEIRKKMDYNKTRPMKHGKRY
jgi:NTP pyrophosphatase (non-canonical NTP hydrolase)